jgi:uncharacterized protein
MPQRDRRDGFLHGVPCWVDTAQPDPEAAAAFYEDLLGWKFKDRMPADSPGHYFVAQLRGRDVAAVGSQPEGSPPAAAWDTYIWVDNAEDAAAKAKEAGGTVLLEPFDVTDAGRMAVIADPYGAAFRVWQANKHKGAQLVNAPGSWNWSNLETSDLEGSSTFYNSVFGWESDIVDFGRGSFAMCRLPGYGDFLEQFDPDLRTRQAGAGAPSGFEDAVAWIVPLSNDGSGGHASPHWSVTFSVDDADAVAERARRLGGRILVPPVDTPPVRVAILSDPQGAVFSVSKFDPAMETR